MMPHKGNHLSSKKLVFFIFGILSPLVGFFLVGCLVPVDSVSCLHGHDRQSLFRHIWHNFTTLPGIVYLALLDGINPQLESVNGEALRCVLGGYKGGWGSPHP